MRQVEMCWMARTTPSTVYSTLFSSVHPRASAAAPQMKSASYLSPLTTHLQVALLGLLERERLT